MSERFKMRCRGSDGTIHFKEVEGEEAFVYRGFRFFSHRDNFKGYGVEWRVSDVRSGIAISHSPFFDDAVEDAKRKIDKNFEKYMQGIKKAPKALWRYKNA